MNVVIDIETKSYADLLKVGSSVYAQDVTTQIIVLAYKIDDQDTKVWWPGMASHDSMPIELHHAIFKGATVEAFNIGFEFSIWLYILHKYFGWPMPPEDQWRDLMATACYYALPAKLDKLHRALGGDGKNPEGDRLIKTYSCLFKPKAVLTIPPDEFQKWCEYVIDDVEDEYEIGQFLGELPPEEVPMFLLDQRMNRRGLYLDEDSIGDALAIVEKVNEELTARFRQLTGYNPGQRDRILGWLNDNGLTLPNLQAGTIEDLFDEASTAPQGIVREALKIRLKLNKASTKKLAKMMEQRGEGGRARYQMRYHGAQTGRNTGGGFQPLNLVRSWEDVDPEQLVADLQPRDPEWLDTVYGDSMEAVAKASRHHIKAEAGNKIYSGDFVSIEAVLLACVAGEEWKIQAFRDKKLIYCINGCMIHNIPLVEVERLGKKGFQQKYPQAYKDGKTCELACGYQGALNAWLKFDDSGTHSDETIIENVRSWRKQHPAVADRNDGLWANLEMEAMDAVRRGVGHETGYRQIGFEIPRARPQWLSMILPNDKRIWYWQPEIRTAMPQWHQPGELEDCENGTCDCKARPVLTYMAQKEGKWFRQYTYGGKLTENAIQATSRELLKPAALHADAAGYEIILTVYDEIVAETGANFGSEAEFKEIMGTCYEDWYSGWPVGVDVWSGQRYRK